MAVALNHAKNPIQGKPVVPLGTAKLMSWNDIENALRRSGEVRPGESVTRFVVANDGMWLVTERTA